MPPVAGGRLLRRAPGRLDRAQPAPAPPGVRRGGDGRAGHSIQRGRPAAAGRGAPDRPRTRYELVMGERRWRATQEAGLTPSRRSSARPVTTRCCATRCWRTCTARSSTRWRRRRPTSSCSRTSAAPTRSSPAASVGRRPQISNTLRLLKLSPAVQRRVAAGVLSAGHARALLGVEDADVQDRLAPGWWPRASPCAASRRSSRSARPRPGPPGAAGRKPHRPGLVDLADRLATGSRPG